MPNQPVDWVLVRLLRQLSSTFWVSIFLTFSINASIASLWSVFVPSETRFDHRFVLVIILFAVILLGGFAEIARRALAEADEQKRLAEVCKIPTPVVRSGVIYENRIFLIVGEARALANDTAVAIYRSMNGFEFEIGVGRVNRIAPADMAQIEIIDRRNDAGLWERIGANEAGLLSTLTVRSALPFDVYQRMIAL